MKLIVKSTLLIYQNLICRQVHDYVGTMKLNLRKVKNQTLNVNKELLCQMLSYFHWVSMLS